MIVESRKTLLRIKEHLVWNQPSFMFTLGLRSSIACRPWPPKKPRNPADLDENSLGSTCPSEAVVQPTNFCWSQSSRKEIKSTPKKVWLIKVGGGEWGPKEFQREIKSLRDRVNEILTGTASADTICLIGSDQRNTSLLSIQSYHDQTKYLASSRVLSMRMNTNLVKTNLLGLLA